MLTIEQARAVAAKVTYKPGWEFNFYQGMWEGPHCSITTELPDAYDQTKTVRLQVECFLSPNDMAGEAELITWMLYRCARIEVHEAREFLRLGNQPWSDPHAENADRDLA